MAFTGAALAELWSITAVLNTPSQAVMRRIGMTEAARFEHPRVPDGSLVKPHVVYHLAIAIRRYAEQVKNIVAVTSASWTGRRRCA